MDKKSPGWTSRIIFCLSGAALLLTIAYFSVDFIAPRQRILQQEISFQQTQPANSLDWADFVGKQQKKISLLGSQIDLKYYHLVSARTGRTDGSIIVEMKVPCKYRDYSGKNQNYNQRVAQYFNSLVADYSASYRRECAAASAKNQLADNHKNNGQMPGDAGGSSGNSPPNNSDDPPTDGSPSTEAPKELQQKDPEEMRISKWLAQKQKQYDQLQRELVLLRSEEEYLACKLTGDIHRNVTVENTLKSSAFQEYIQPMLSETLAKDEQLRQNQGQARILRRKVENLDLQRGRCQSEIQLEKLDREKKWAVEGLYELNKKITQRQEELTSQVKKDLLDDYNQQIKGSMQEQEYLLRACRKQIAVLDNRIANLRDHINFAQSLIDDGNLKDNNFSGEEQSQNRNAGQGEEQTQLASNSGKSSETADLKSVPADTAAIQTGKLNASAQSQRDRQAARAGQPPQIIMPLGQIRENIHYSYIQLLALGLAIFVGGGLGLILHPHIIRAQPETQQEEYDEGIADNDNHYTGTKLVEPDEYRLATATEPEANIKAAPEDNPEKTPEEAKGTSRIGEPETGRLITAGELDDLRFGEKPASAAHQLPYKRVEPSGPKSLAEQTDGRQRQFNVAAGQIIQFTQKKTHPVIMVSSLDKEGYCPRTVIDLAIALIAQRQKVLLAGYRSGSQLNQVFDYEPSREIAETADTTESDIVVSSPLRGLDFIADGTDSQQPQGQRDHILADPQEQQRLRENYDIVLVYCPVPFWQTNNTINPQLRTISFIDGLFLQSSAALGPQQLRQLSNIVQKENLNLLGIIAGV